MESHKAGESVGLRDGSVSLHVFFQELNFSMFISLYVQVSEEQASIAEESITVGIPVCPPPQGQGCVQSAHTGVSETQPAVPSSSVQHTNLPLIVWSDVCVSNMSTATDCMGQDNMRMGLDVNWVPDDAVEQQVRSTEVYGQKALCLAVEVSNLEPTVGNGSISTEESFQQAGRKYACRDEHVANASWPASHRVAHAAGHPAWNSAAGCVTVVSAEIDAGCRDCIGDDVSLCSRHGTNASIRDSLGTCAWDQHVVDLDMRHSCEPQVLAQSAEVACSVHDVMNTMNAAHVVPAQHVSDSIPHVDKGSTRSWDSKASYVLPSQRGDENLALDFNVELLEQVAKVQVRCSPGTRFM